MLERGDMARRYEGAHILDVQRRLGGDAIGCEELVDAGAQILAVDEEFEWDGLVGLEKTVDEGGELVTAELCRLPVVSCLLLLPRQEQAMHATRGRNTTRNRNRGRRIARR